MFVGFFAAALNVCWQLAVKSTTLEASMQVQIPRHSNRGGFFFLSLHGPELLRANAIAALPGHAQCGPLTTETGVGCVNLLIVGRPCFRY